MKPVLKNQETKESSNDTLFLWCYGFISMFYSVINSNNISLFFEIAF